MAGSRNILIKGARVNNLKNITVELPSKKLVLITGVSGSGKSSLAFDTLYAEGQRRYVESLSSYARQFLARMEKPDVDYIQGISPALAIEQKSASNNPRSTVGTSTEIYDFLKLLYARLGKTYSPISGELVTRDTVTDVIEAILGHQEGAKIHLFAKVPVRSQGYKRELELTLQKGFTRILEAGEILEIEDLIPKAGKKGPDFLMLLVDRLILKDKSSDEMRFRIGDSVQTAYQEGQGVAFIQVDDEPVKEYNEKFERDGIEFEIPSVNFFSFNNPYGACKSCEGFGRVLGVDEDLIIPDKTLSVFEGAIAPWRGEVMSKYQDAFIKAAIGTDFPIHRSWVDLTDEEKDQVRFGLNGAWGFRQFFKYLESKTHKIQYRVMLSRYRGYTLCEECNGSRIRKEAAYVKISGISLPQLLMKQINQLPEIFQGMELTDSQRQIGDRLFREINARIEYMLKVGLGYLNLNRKIATLSGGEMQRIRLATSLGSGLVGSMYILDEPSIGLHPRDTDQLISILEALRDQGNTVIVVEHDEGIIRKSDQIIDIGPGAGELGGEVVFQGNLEDLILSDTLTARYMTGRENIDVPAFRRKKINSLILRGAAEHNLKGVDVEFPLNAMTVVTGVSGSGKTTLVKGILYPLIRRDLEEFGTRPGAYREFSGEISEVRYVEMVDQSPIGRSARSNPATYIKAWDYIRILYADLPTSQLRNLKPGSFSFNVEGGRCEMCKGEGTVTIEMQFLPDITLTCEACQGKRFKKQVLDVKYKGKNIDDVLKMTIHEAVDFFSDERKIQEKLNILNEVGLGYLRMGQSSTTLSGGEAQRVKLAFFLAHAKDRKGTLYIFDEPTTGLHFDDIKKLLFAINRLVENGNTVIIIEHNLDVIKCADWIIDLGPEGGDQGGKLVFQGTPEDLLNEKNSHTARYLAGKLKAIQTKQT